MGGDQDPKNPEGKLSDQLKLADDIRRFEIAHFWIRSLFFAGILAAVFTGMRDARQSEPLVAVILWSLGLVCALAWSLANRGGKFWQETWEPHGLDYLKLKKQAEAEKTDSERNAPPKAKSKLAFLWTWNPWNGSRYSPSKMAMAVSDAAFAAWIVLGLSQLPAIRLPSVGAAAAVVAAAVIYCAVMFWKGRGDDRKENKDAE